MLLYLPVIYFFKYKFYYNAYIFIDEVCAKFVRTRTTPVLMYGVYIRVWIMLLRSISAMKKKIKLLPREDGSETPERAI